MKLEVLKLECVLTERAIVELQDLGEKFELAIFNTETGNYEATLLSLEEARELCTFLGSKV